MVGSTIDSGGMAFSCDACVLWLWEGANEVTVEERQVNAMQAADVARLIYFEWFVFCELNWFGYALKSFKFQLCWSIKISWLMPSPRGLTRS